MVGSIWIRCSFLWRPNRESLTNKRQRNSLEIDYRPCEGEGTPASGRSLAAIMRNPAALRTEVEVLRPETIATRKLPANFNQEDLGLFQHELERVIPQTKLIELQNVGVSADGVLFQRGKILSESFAFSANRENWRRRSRLRFIANNYLFRRRRRFEQAGVWVVDDWSGGYFHWLADVLPRLLTVRKQLKDWVLLLPYQFKNLKFVEASLKPFALKSIEYINASEVLFCPKLMMPTHTAPSGQHNEALIREVGNLLVQFYENENGQPFGEKVYLSRSLALKRRLLNEDEVIEVLREFDFRIIRPEEYSFAEQVQIASQARYLMSNHGAGLTNTLFMSPGASVLELRHAADRINNCYFTLASALNLNYFYQSCEPENRVEDPHTANLKVNTAALRANVKLLLGL